MSHGHPRLVVIAAVERFAVYARYLTFACLAPLFFVKPNEGEWRDAMGALTVIVLHNAFAHWVLQKKRYSMFASWQNAAIYLAEATYLLAITGAQRSEAYLFFIFILIGAGAYSRNMRVTVLITTASCGCMAGVFAYGWFFMGQTELLGVVAAKLAGVIISGWLVGVAASQAERLELDTVEKSAALEESERVLRTILDSTADPILVFDNNEFVVDANEAASAMLQIDREEIKGRRVRAFLFDDGTLPTKFSSLRKRGAYYGEQIVLDANGEERNTEMHIRKFLRKDDPFFVTLLHDVTDRQNLQEATRSANVRLERLNRELKHVDDLKTGILRTMAQRLLSPLSPLLGYLQMLLDEELGELNPEQRKAVQGCRRSAIRLARIAEQSLAIGSGPNEEKRQEDAVREPYGKEEHLKSVDADPVTPTMSSEKPAP
jgi:PAS domain S-box-containing protein